MAKADTSVKFGYSELADTPIITGLAGEMIQLLDAVLVNGYCIRTADSVVVTSEVATVSISAGVPYPEHAVIAMSGASVSALNDDWRIHSVTGSTFKFNCPGVADGTSIGTISVKMSPAGWEKVFSDGHFAAYRSLSPLGSGAFLWVNDNDPRFSRVRGYESMSSISSGTNPFPTEIQAALNSYTWAKNSTTTPGVRNWRFCGDSRFFYVGMCFINNAPNTATIYRFGDLATINDGFSKMPAILAHQSNTVTASTSYISAQIGDSGGNYKARASSGSYAPELFIGVCAVSSPGLSTKLSDTVFCAPAYALDGAATTSEVIAEIPGWLPVRGRLITNIDNNVVAVGDDLVFFVRHTDGAPAASELTYSGFSLAPSKGWR